MNSYRSGATKRLGWTPPGVAARDPGSYQLPDFRTLGDGPYPPILLEAMGRGGDRFKRWNEQVEHTGYCCRPIRLRGKVEKIDKETGEVRGAYSTEGEPDDVLLVACGSRRASRCRSCASWYRRDAFHLVAAGLRGGKGIPASVEAHPKIFVTFTAPSFGAVHVRRVKGSRTLPCRPRDKARVCPHGARSGCSVRHAEGDPAIGTPLCLACFDAEGQVVWNAMAPALWHRTWTYFSRELATVMGVSHKKLLSLVKPRMVKVGEYQRRGAIHFHAIIRLDAAPPADDPEAVAPPPEHFTVDVLEEAIRAVRDSAVVSCPELAALGKSDTSIRWGSALDVRTIRGDGPGELTHEAVAAYASKYCVKTSEALGLPQRRIEDDDDIDAFEAPEHIRRLVWTCCVLGRKGELAGLKLRDRAHGLGFGGHFLTKSRRYSTTMGALRKVRRDHVRRQLLGESGVALDAWGRPEDRGLVEVVRRWRYTGWGYRTHGEAWMAATAAARAREERELAREDLMSRVA